MKILASIFLMLIGTCALAQYHSSAFSVGWNTLKPLTEEFTTKTSSAGMRIGYSKFLNQRFGFGIEGGFNTLDDYIPRQTYEYPGGAVTTDLYYYLYYFTLMANAQYYFVQGKHFIPYASLGMGVAFSDYRVYFNVYSESDNQTSFVARPEIGTLFRVKETASWGLKSAVSFDFATNKSDQFEAGNFSGVSFQIGVVLFAD